MQPRQNAHQGPNLPEPQSPPTPSKRHAADDGGQGMHTAPEQHMHTASPVSPQAGQGPPDRACTQPQPQQKPSIPLQCMGPQAHIRKPPTPRQGVHPATHPAKAPTPLHVHGPSGSHPQASHPQTERAPSHKPSKSPNPITSAGPPPPSNPLSQISSACRHPH